MAGVSGTARQVKVTWKCSASHVDHYVVQCQYHTSKNGWMVAGEYSSESKQYLWTVPSNYTINQIGFRIWAVSAKTKTVTTGSGKSKKTTTTTWWTDGWEQVRFGSLPSNVKSDNDDHNAKIQAANTAASHFKAGQKAWKNAQDAKTATKEVAYWKRSATEFAEAATYYGKAGDATNKAIAQGNATRAKGYAKDVADEYVSAAMASGKSYDGTGKSSVKAASDSRKARKYAEAKSSEKAAAGYYRKAASEYQEVLDFEYSTQSQKDKATTAKAASNGAANACDSRADQDAADYTSYEVTKPANPTSLSVSVANRANNAVALTLSFACPAVWAAYVQVRVSVDGGSWQDYAGNYVGKAVGSANSAMSHTYTGSVGHTYRFAIRSTLANKKVASDWVFGDTIHAKPQAASGFYLSAVSSTSVRADWTNNGKSRTAIEVQWSTYFGRDNAWNEGALSEISSSGDLPASTTHYTITGLTPGKKLYVRVLSKSPNGDTWATLKADSRYGTATIVPPMTANNLGALTGLAAAQQPGYPRNAVLTWLGKLESGAHLEVDYSSNTSALQYNVQSAITTVEIDSTGWPVGSSTTQRTFTVADLEHGTKYWFRVRKVHPGSETMNALTVFATAKADGKTSYCWYTVPAKGEASIDGPTAIVGSLKPYAGAIGLAWNCEAGNKSYEVQYTDNPYAFGDNAEGDIETVSYDAFSASDTSFVYTLTDLDEGRMWYARVRAVGDDAHSGWGAVSEEQGEGAARVSATVVGVELPPAEGSSEQLYAPTPTRTDAAYSTGSVVALSWVHNSEEESAQSAYQLMLRVTVPGQDESQTVIDGTTDNAYALDLGSTADGTAVEWGVRTAGVVPSAWSPWSAFQRFSVVAPPQAGASLADGNGDPVDSEHPLTALPLAIAVTANAGTGDAVVRFDASITATESHRTYADDGSEAFVAEGEAVWSGSIASTDEGFDPAGATFSVAGRDAVLDNGQAYAVAVRAFTALGMVAESAPLAFGVDWGAEMPLPSGTAVFDGDDYTCRIFPACYVGEAEEEEGETEQEGEAEQGGTQEAGQEQETEQEQEEEQGNDEDADIDEMARELDEAAVDGDYYDEEPEEDEPHYTAPYDEDEDFTKLRQGTELDVYRVDYDGSTVLIAEGLPNNGRASCTDPHPNFGTARYRIVAHDTATDTQSSFEIEAIADVKSVVITWDESWKANDDGDFGEYYGSRCVLPHGLTLDEVPLADTAIVKFAGNRYGTLYTGESGDYECSYGMALLEVGEGDSVDALRKLEAHRGACYVRDPSGLGFWARVAVRFSHTLSFRKRSARIEVSRVMPPGGAA